MDVLRHFRHAQTFRLLAQDLAGRLSVRASPTHLSALADVILAATLARVWAYVEGRDAAPPKLRSWVCKLGGGLGRVRPRSRFPL